MKHIGNEISRIMFEKGITGVWLAKQIGVSTNYISDIRDKEKINAAMLEKIANRLNVSICTFFNEDASNLSVVKEENPVYQKTSKREKELEEEVQFLRKELQDKQEMINMFKSGELIVSNPRKQAG